ncbi:MAG: hypothetical protein JWQ35_869, partial [Bacteriovoracaceae bacterium]|nr:hypothetical protein [Bacteriovoracaceae bacterium]
KVPRKGSIYFPNLLALSILALAPFFPHFWYVVPAGVSILFRSRSRFLKLIPWLALLNMIYFGIWTNPEITKLDALSIFLFFLEGLCLHWIIKGRAKLLYVVMFPLFFAFILSVLLFAFDRGSSAKNYLDWASSQISSEVFPYFFRMDDWPEPIIGIYQTILLPILKAGIFAWFASMVAMAFFVNGVLENFMRGLGSPRKSLRPKIWDEFSKWRSPDYVLVTLVLGMLILAAPHFYPGLDSVPLQVIGWNLAILSLFPIFIQGIALASYLIPRVSIFIFVVIFTLLVFKPIPVLILAGLSDLWFDFRSKIRSDPKST